MVPRRKICILDEKNCLNGNSQRNYYLFACFLFFIYCEICIERDKFFIMIFLNLFYVN